MTTTNYNYWDSAALIDGFDQKSAASFFRSETWFLDQIAPQGLSSVLDIGCSCGRFLELLQQRYAFCGHYVGLDISEPSIRRCRENYPGQQFWHANALSYEFEQTFDLVNATGVMQHEPRYMGLLQRMLDVSNRYVLFDVKLAEIEKDIVDDRAAYCQMGDSRIHIIALGLDYLVRQLQQLHGVGKVRILGYETPFNQATVLPDYLTRWVSAGVLIDTQEEFSVEICELPDYLTE